MKIFDSKKRNARLDEITKLVKRDWLPDKIEEKSIEIDLWLARMNNLQADTEMIKYL